MTIILRIIDSNIGEKERTTNIPKLFNKANLLVPGSITGPEIGFPAN